LGDGEIRIAGDISYFCRFVRMYTYRQFLSVREPPKRAGGDEADFEHPFLTPTQGWGIERFLRLPLLFRQTFLTFLFFFLHGHTKHEVKNTVVPFKRGHLRGQTFCPFNRGFPYPEVNIWRSLFEGTRIRVPSIEVSFIRRCPLWEVLLIYKIFIPNE